MRASLTDADKDAGATHEAGSWCWRISRAGDPDVQTNNYPDNQADDAREIVKPTIRELASFTHGLA